ncbi:MAG: undecaprenyl/decaprenyl-phosphate alpha-N-acetylglucosaminyl 1-phosphate transferase [Verrucomicrobia bacterium]|nr:undecaprenyl/decaprenyl-phosphate alpha-N-acetylglucosaminyl 1-phosphate transferase [Verrucomicrobiota bacterium]
MPFLQRFCTRIGLLDKPGERKIHIAPVPLAGGWAVFLGLAVTLVGGLVFIWLPVSDQGYIEPLRYGFTQRAWELAGIIGGAFGMLILGWIDDMFALKPAVKFVGQWIIASLVVLAGIRITLFVPDIVFSYVITVSWILTITNAVNFMDNMNGLCAGVGCIGAFWFGLWSALCGHYLVASMALSVSGALLGFLPYNFPRAVAFMGDAGSHMTGFLLAILGILPHFYSGADTSRLAVISPLVILAVPLFDLVWVVLIRIRNHKPFYIGDTNHISHRLVRSGMSQSAAVMLIWLIAAIAGALPLLFL